jgi:redox-sensitive bicupin YhaK (pirin superfamily)
MGPAEVTEEHGLDVGPHPHIGLQTVTWLMSGAALHKDSLGSEQLIRPGQLNLMTAGHGIVHAEEATRTYRGTLHGMQLWVAQPDALRAGASDFAHHADLPIVELGGAQGTVLAGTFIQVASPARFGSPLVGVDLVLPAGGTPVPLVPEWEYAVVPVGGSALVAGNVVRPGQLGALGSGRDEVMVEGPARVLLLGGEPLNEPLVMWWNFVARSRDEIALAYRQWQQGDERFGGVPSRLARITAPAPPWLG